MRLLTFRDSPAHIVDQFGSHGGSITGIAHGEGPHQIGYFRLGAGSVIGRHPAGVPQLLLVVDGEGWVSGGDGERRQISAGMAAYWDAGEEHETSSSTGLAALVLESASLDLHRALVEVVDRD